MFKEVIDEAETSNDLIWLALFFYFLNQPKGDETINEFLKYHPELKEKIKEIENKGGSN